MFLEDASLCTLVLNANNDQESKKVNYICYTFQECRNLFYLKYFIKGRFLSVLYLKGLFSIIYLFLKDFIYLFMRDTHTQREREAETQAEGEADSLWGA